MTDESPPIVVGVDGSPVSVEALSWALAHGALMGREVVALHAWSVPIGLGGSPLLYTQDWQALAQTILDEALEALGHDQIRPSRQVVQGHAARVLLEASARCELLVLGSRGHGGFPGLLLGSVAQHVVGLASCPVLVVPPRPLAVLRGHVG